MAPQKLSKPVRTGAIPVRSGASAAVDRRGFEVALDRAGPTPCRARTDVIDCRAQPFRMEFTVDGRRHAYIIDRVSLQDAILSGRRVAMGSGVGWRGER